MNNNKIYVIITNNFQNLIFLIPIDFKLGLINFEFQILILV